MTAGETRTQAGNGEIDVSADVGIENPHTGTGAGWMQFPAAALMLWLVTAAKSAALFMVAAVVTFVTGRPAVGWPLVAVVAVMLVSPVMRWLTVRYRLGEDGVVLREALFSHRQRTIPYGHIHAISAEQPPVLRLFGMVRLIISSGDATDGSITLDAVPASLQLEIETRRRTAATGEMAGTTGATTTNETAMDETVTGSPTALTPAASSSAESNPAEPEPAAPDPAIPAAVAPVSGRLVYRASTRDILLFALTDLSLLVWALALWGLLQKADDWFPSQTEAAVSGATALVLAHGVLGVLAALAAALVLLLLISVVASLLRYTGFEAWRRGNDLVVVRGVLTRRTITIPVERIQSVTIARNPLRKALRLCSVEVGLSASLRDNDDSDDSSASDDAKLLPVIGDDRVITVLHAMLPEWDVRPVPVHHTGRGLLRMYLTAPLTMTAVGLIAAVGGALTSGGMAAAVRIFRLHSLAPVHGVMIAGAAVALIGLFWAVTRWLKYRTDGYALLPDADETEGTVIHGTGTDSNNHAADNATIAPLPHRILMTTASGLAMHTIVTRRTRVQSIERKTTPWRQRAGVERLIMPLYVANGPSELRFTALRRADADRLAAWFDGSDSGTSACPAV